MNTKLYSSVIITLLVAGIVLTIPVTSVHAWGWRSSVTKIETRGNGFPWGDPHRTVEEFIECGDAIIQKGVVEIFYESWWLKPSEGKWPPDFPPSTPPDSRMAGVTTYRGSAVFKDDVLYSVSTITLLPDAYQCGDTYTGWWEGWGYGRAWFEGDQVVDFEYKHRLYGRGEFAGLKLVHTISLANILDDGYVIHGYFIDMT
jgi:hypothetical protein